MKELTEQERRILRFMGEDRTDRPKMREAVMKCKVTRLHFLRSTSQSAYQALSMLLSRRRNVVAETGICDQSGQWNGRTCTQAQQVKEKMTSEKSWQKHALDRMSERKRLLCTS